MYRWTELFEDVGTVVKTKTMLTNAIKATKIAAALGDFFPVSKQMGMLMVGIANTARRAGNSFCYSPPTVNIISTIIRMKPTTAAAM